MVLVIVAAVLLSSCRTTQLDSTDLEAAASKTTHEYYTAVRNGTEPDADNISPKYWSASLKNLKPLRIYTHRVNVVVVREENEEIEKGRYIYITVSSYLPTTGDDGFTFTARNDGTWDYERRKD